MSAGSITSSPSFHARLIRSEAWRAAILGGVWFIMAMLVLIRRLVGGYVMSYDPLFYSCMGVLVAACLFQAWVIYDTRRCVRSGAPRFRWAWLVSAIADLTFPLAYLCVSVFLSPRGATAAVSGPVILSLPLVLTISILRLKPLVSFWSGVGAAIGHLGIVAVAIRIDSIEPHQWPLLFNYAVLLLITGGACSLVASQARAYVVDAVEESLAAERRERELADIERDLSIARDIQRSLMPSQAPSMPGYDIAGMARSAQQTGGDYYDWQELPDGRLLVVLADVTGHGIGPALVMAVCRAYARATAPLANDPAELLTRLNALICPDLAASGRFITMVIAVLSPDGKVEIISAGHGPTLLHQSATGRVEAFHGDGIPLGIDDGERYLSVNTRHLKPGDALLLVTDGFFEWPRAGHEMFGVERLEETFRAGSNLSASQMLEHLDAAAHAFAAGAPQADDTTAVAIRRM